MNAWKRFPEHALPSSGRFPEHALPSSGRFPEHALPSPFPPLKYLGIYK
jgi:hypothetical protein